MTFAYEGYGLVPGLQDALNTTENQFWVGRYESQQWVAEVIDNSTVDAGNTSNTTSLRAGMILGKITTGADAGKVKQWDPTATDGSQYCYGILGTMMGTSFQGSTKDRFMGFILVAGMVDPAKLLVGGDTSLGLSGVAEEYDVYAQFAGRILFYRDFSNAAPMGSSWRNVVTKTADYTVLDTDNGTLFETTGAAGAVNFTLPATAKRGLRFGFYNAADQNMTVTAGTADTMVAFNDIAADSVAFSTTSEKVGGMFEVIGTGTKWLVMPTLGQDSQTVTVAT